MKLFKLAPVLILIIAATAFAADEKDFKSWLQGQQKQYKSFLEQRDKEFHSFLKGEWKNFEVEEGVEEDSAPKPDTPPVAEKEIKESKPIKPDKIKKIEKIVKEEKPEKEAEPVIEKPKQKMLAIGFFGELLKFPEIEGLKNIKPVSADKDSVAKFWESFASNDLSPVLGQLKYYKYKKSFNDWGLFLLAKAYSDKINKDENTSLLILWGLMLKSGYDVRAGFADNKIKILFASESDLYSNPFFTLDGKRYYLFKDKDVSIKSYDASYEGADKKIRAFFSKRPDISTYKPGEKKLNFKYKGKDYLFETYYNPGLIAFMSSLPQFSLDKYFIGEPDFYISNKFAGAIKKATKDFSDYEKVNFILRLVQKSFPYKTDEEQFKKEKYFYPEEMIYYPYSDCEDRSSLFASLVKEVTGFKVVILDYPGHVATAVNIPQSLEGDYIELGNKKYYVADPTYINADVGMIMPGYEDKKPQIISVN